MMKALLLVLLLVGSVFAQEASVTARPLAFTYAPEGIQVELPDGGIDFVQVTFTNTDPGALQFSLTPKAAWIEATPNTFVIAPGDSQVVSFRIYSLQGEKQSAVDFSVSSALSSEVSQRTIPVAVLPTSQTDQRVDTGLWILAAIIVAGVGISLVYQGRGRKR